MDVMKLAELGKRMRDAQRRFFRHRDGADLRLSLAMEEEFDRAVKEALAQRGLFDGEKKEEEHRG